jgi:hypothetical protein
VRLKGQHDDYFVASNSNNLIDICKENTSSDYMVWNTPTLIPENETLNIRTARYSYLNSKMEGAGIINLYAGAIDRHTVMHVACHVFCLMFMFLDVV